MTELWFRNPLTYVRECAELLVPNIVWDRGVLVKHRVDATKHYELHIPSIVNYRILLVGDQGTAELRRGHTLANPVAVYPTWEYGLQTIPELEELLRVQKIPKGKRPDECGTVGQEHRVVVIRPPGADTKEGVAFITMLRELQYEYPKAIIHYHGTYSFKVAFGSDFAAADIDPVPNAAKGKIVFGSGRIVQYELAEGYPAWTSLSGFRPSELKVARNRTMFIMRSAMWAAVNWNEDLRWRSVSKRDAVVDYTSPTPVPATVRKPYGDAKPVKGDKFACDFCSLARTCRYQRDGGVCIVPDSDTSGLARYFKTRDSGQIIDGLGRVMEAQLKRAERGLRDEENSPDLDPEVTKILKNVFDNGVKLAKLVDPNLAGGTKVGVFIGGNAAAAVGARSENELVSAVVAELEASGVKRTDIDAEMVAQYLANRNRGAIEATSSGD